MSAVEARALTKRYGDVTAVENLDLEIEEGEVFGFLGPNGAGKTTTIDVLLSYKQPTSGEVELLDSDPRDRDVRREVGILPEDFGVYPRLTGREHVEFAVRSKDVDADVDGLLGRVGLDGEGERRAGGYSKGMKKRLVLATALVGEPDLLVLDEPTSGLDPNGARRIREIALEENDRGATVFFSSHVLGQVEAVCSRVGIMQDGRMEAVNSIEGLREEIHAVSRLELTVAGDVEAAAEAARQVEDVVDVEHEDEVVAVHCRRGETKLETLDSVREAAEVVDLRTREKSLEELFAEYTGEP